MASSLGNFFSSLSERVEKMLAVGLRFAPKDEELCSLLHQKFAKPHIPTFGIAEFDVYAVEPWFLPKMDGARDKYFFVYKGRNHWKKNRIVTALPQGLGGWWEVIGYKNIYNEGGITIGYAKTMQFIHGKKNNWKSLLNFVTHKKLYEIGQRTNWFINEYHLVRSKEDKKNGEWVVCKLKQLTEYGGGRYFLF